jgi:hypothetical protein
MNIGYTLSLRTGRDTSFCRFIPLCDGLVRVLAYATHTDYTSDFVVECEDAKAVWREKRAAGFARDLDGEAFLASREADRAPEQVGRLRAGARARLAA